MRRLSATFFGCLACLMFLSASAQADFGLNEFDVSFTEADGSPTTQAGAHPYAMTTTFFANTTEREGKVVPVESIKDVLAFQVPGFAGNQSAVPLCSNLDFLNVPRFEEGGDLTVPACAEGSVVGTIAIYLRPTLKALYSPVYLLDPAPGKAAKLGFWVEGVPVTVDIALSESPPYEIIGTSSNISQILTFYGAELTLWGDPADPRHDEERGACHRGGPKQNREPGAKCPAGTSEVPFLTVPRACERPLVSRYEADSWINPGAFVAGSSPASQLIGCGKLGFGPTITAQPTTKAATSPTGLDFSLDVEDEGLTNPHEGATAAADIEKAEVTLPAGMSVNPSQAEGLEVCTEAQLANETAFSASGAGCPNAAKVGSLEVETPLLEGKLLKGSLYVAAPYENPFNSLIALYIVIKSPELGISVVQAAKVTSDPTTGRLVTTTEEMPQLPFSHFRLHFKEGTRSPLVSPPACGTYQVAAKLYPSSGNPPVTSTSTFEVISGPDNTPCPTGGVPPFHPFLSAGTINNAAGKYSPFNTRISRSDSEQEITNFSIKLPPGIIGKLAGIPYCPDAAIAAAKARTGPHGGSEELEAPSCPAASEVGHSLAGAGVGSVLAYAPGRLYLAGPYHGSNLSLVSVTAAKVGPFDLGTVVVRFALKINPETAEVFVDATGSDPIPHIIQGIPVHLRDIRAYVDRPEFVLNPTSCKRTSTASTLLGSGLNFASPADDVPVTVTSPFQAADCASLGFAPKLALSLKGGTKRGDTPAFKAVLTYPKGYQANIAKSVVTLPHSVFLEQAHIKTICTRAQFKEGTVPGEKCPAASIYGKAEAITPLLAEPLKGPVYLRSSSHNLPDLVAALHNAQVDFALDGRIDSVKNGRIRNTFETVPDAPVSKFTLEMQGAKKGLLVNSTNLCKGTNKAISEFTGQNGKTADSRPVVTNSCGGAKKKSSHRRGR